MLEDIVQTLEAIGKPTEVYESPDGSRVLILPHGGRILGLFSPQSSENFCWTHPALVSAETARAFYASGEWQNSGGDRTWLAPEADIFFPNFPKLDKYWQPRELDPGNYHVVAREGGLRLVNRLKLTLSRSKQQVELEISKQVTAAPNPVRYERDVRDLAGVEYAGYTLRCSLALLGTEMDSSVCVGLWNLLQLPHGGELMVATHARAEPKIWMGEIPPDDLVVSDHLIRYRMRAKGGQKIGIRALATTGRVGYLCRTGRQFALVVRNFFVNPSGEYVDVPWAEPDDLGYSVQACNIDNDFGEFSELECHSPAIGPATGRLRSDDESVVWAFRGPEDAIQTIARCLLSPTV